VLCCRRSWRAVARDDEVWLPWLQCLFKYQPHPAEATGQQQQQQPRELLTSPTVRQCPLAPGSLPPGTAMAAFGHLAAGGRGPDSPQACWVSHQPSASCCVVSSRGLACSSLAQLRISGSARYVDSTCLQLLPSFQPGGCCTFQVCCAASLACCPACSPPTGAAALDLLQGAAGGPLALAAAAPAAGTPAAAAAATPDTRSAAAAPTCATGCPCCPTVCGAGELQVLMHLAALVHGCMQVHVHGSQET
jgi:hypothetical protein